MNNLAISIIALIVSIGSLAISFWNFEQKRLPLEVRIDEKTLSINGLLSESGTFLTLGNNFVLSDMLIINPSLNDISYFDLQVFDHDTGKELEFLKQENLTKINNLSNENVYSAVGTDHTYHIKLPSGITDTVKARTVLQVSILAKPLKETKKIDIKFKTSRRHFSWCSLHSDYEEFVETSTVGKQ